MSNKSSDKLAVEDRTNAGTPELTLATRDRDTQERLLDSNWEAGATFGWNCGVTGSREKFYEAIRCREAQRIEAARDAASNVTSRR